ncbi:uncharacterized protein LOC125828059 [Solanum verrucosum]|uniref:uncharacterized protein LOC125828059 n=1 Tax=Solanum verrucosum TaxID=315347 RepID=UPI0020D1D28E|nr:uncharacterized protein LOC125828059 [Solanum verrucosum]
MAASRVQDFTRMNFPEFYGSKVKEVPQEFIDEVYKVLTIIVVTLVEKAELAAGQLKDVAQIWFNQWKEARPIDAGPLGMGEVSNPKLQGGGNGSSLPNCAKCGRKHERKCVAVSNACFGCGKTDHKIRDCSSIDKNEGDNHRRAQPYLSFSPSCSGSNAPKKNRFYAFQTRVEQEGSFDVVTDPFSVSTPVGDSVLADRVYRKCPISLSHRVTLVDLIELHMLDFDVILGMDWLHSCYASINCRNRVVKFQFPNELVLEWKRGNLCQKVGLFLILKPER